MTRINCVPPDTLTDKHLIAEYRELPRISALARIASDAPNDYVLGKGHCKFFYDKGAYLKNRFENEIVPEMLRRGFKANYREYREHPAGLNNGWTPRPQDIVINVQRIMNRLKGKK
jgi:deoxyribonuclease (pyrimidine dimer)